MGRTTISKITKPDFTPVPMPTDKQLKARGYTKLPAVRRLGRDERVRRIKRWLQKEVPGLRDQKFAPMVASYARLTVLSLNAYDFLRKKGLEGKDGELRTSVQEVRRLLEAHIKVSAQLGLTPVGELLLRGDKPTDIIAQLAKVAERETGASADNKDGATDDKQPKSDQTN